MMMGKHIVVNEDVLFHHCHKCNNTLEEKEKDKEMDNEEEEQQAEDKTEEETEKEGMRCMEGVHAMEKFDIMKEVRMSSGFLDN